MENPAKPIGKFILGGAVIIGGTAAIYLAVVIQIYLLAWIVGLIEKLF